jgi:hypothetical protein
LVSVQIDHHTSRRFFQLQTAGRTNSSYCEGFIAPPTPKSTGGLAHVEALPEKESTTPVVFIRLDAIDRKKNTDIAPVYWSDNYVTL